nr:tyrosine-type recombinase/integrase [uncultured Albidiferax sp.]
MSTLPVTKGQLHRLAPRDFFIFDSLSNGKVIKRECGSLPFVRWPDDSWCMEANLYMHKLDDESKSRRGRGGTLGTFISHISHLLKFVRSEGTTLGLLNDKQFGEFLESLAQEKSVRGGTLTNARNRSSARNIGVTCLNFLDFLSDFYGEPGLVSSTGRIRATQVAVTKQMLGGKTSVSYHWHHRGLALPEPVNHRFPINESDLNLLKVKASESTRSNSNELNVNPKEVRRADFLRQRRQVLLSVLDETGMRRMEATDLTVGDVQALINQMYKDHEAANNNSELVKLLGPYGFKFSTVKHKKKTHRITPVNAIFVQVLHSHLAARARFLRKFFGLQSVSPTDPFFVSSETGGRLEPNSLTTEMSMLADKAGIKKRATSPHLVRHLFIVRLFVRLLMAHNIESKDEFRRLLVSNDHFKEMVAELSGHATHESLKPYLTIAIHQIAEIQKTLSRVQYQNYMDSLRKRRDQLLSDVRNGADPAKTLILLSEAITAMDAPLRDVALFKEASENL